MDLMRKRKDSKIRSKKDKALKKLITQSDSDSDESEHELSHYLNDRVKLMKEVLKIIKPKKIKNMAPECIKNLDNGEINSMLLEELLGISNKRLKYIFNGQNLEEDSSSTDPEVEQQPIDVISLDDITDDDFIIDLDSENEGTKKRHKKHKLKIKQECKRKKIKKEKQDHAKSSKKSNAPNKNKMDEQNLMSVLELLELQARARAIRSQLVLENNRKTQELEKNETKETKTEESDNDDAIIIESPKNIEIVITSSESEMEDSGKRNNCIESEVKSTGEENSNMKHTPKSAAKEFNTEQVKSVENHELEVQNCNTPEPECEIASCVDETGIEPSDDTLNESRNKITNVETIIISPAKNSGVSNEKSKKNKSEKEKSNEDSEGEEVKAKKSKNQVKDHSGVDKTNTIVAEESDGIIINLEQSEIDCIISD